MKLSRNKMLLVSFMLFSLFFGAGNLIFPPFLGQNAGSHTLPAMLGFLATAVVLPVLGVVVVARFDGLDRSISLSVPVLASPVPPLFPLRWRWPPICRRAPIPPCGCWYTRWRSFWWPYGCA